MSEDINRRKASILSIESGSAGDGPAVSASAEVSSPMIGKSQRRFSSSTATTIAPPPSASLIDTTKERNKLVGRETLNEAKQLIKDAKESIKESHNIRGGGRSSSLHPQQQHHRQSSTVLRGGEPSSIEKHLYSDNYGAFSNSHPGGDHDTRDFFSADGTPNTTPSVNMAQQHSNALLHPSAQRGQQQHHTANSANSDPTSNNTVYNGIGGVQGLRAGKWRKQPHERAEKLSIALMDQLLKSVSCPNLDCVSANDYAIRLHDVISHQFDLSLPMSTVNNTIVGHGKDPSSRTERMLTRADEHETGDALTTLKKAYNELEEETVSLRAEVARFEEKAVKLEPVYETVKATRKALGALKNTVKFTILDLQDMVQKSINEFQAMPLVKTILASSSAGGGGASGAGMSLARQRDNAATATALRERNPFRDPANLYRAMISSTAKSIAVLQHKVGDLYARESKQQEQAKLLQLQSLENAAADGSLLLNMSATGGGSEGGLAAAAAVVPNSDAKKKKSGGGNASAAGTKKKKGKSKSVVAENDSAAGGINLGDDEVSASAAFAAAVNDNPSDEVDDDEDEDELEFPASIKPALDVMEDQEKAIKNATWQQFYNYRGTEENFVKVVSWLLSEYKTLEQVKHRMRREIWKKELQVSELKKINEIQNLQLLRKEQQISSSSGAKAGGGRTRSPDGGPSSKSGTPATGSSKKNSGKKNSSTSGSKAATPAAGSRAASKQGTRSKGPASSKEKQSDNNDNDTGAAKIANGDDDLSPENTHEGGKENGEGRTGTETDPTDEGSKPLSPPLPSLSPYVETLLQYLLEWVEGNLLELQALQNFKANNLPGNSNSTSAEASTSGPGSAMLASQQSFAFGGGGGAAGSSSQTSLVLLRVLEGIKQYLRYLPEHLKNKHQLQEPKGTTTEEEANDDGLKTTGEASSSIKDSSTEETTTEEAAHPSSLAYFSIPSSLVDMSLLVDEQKSFLPSDLSAPGGGGLTSGKSFFTGNTSQLPYSTSASASFWVGQKPNGPAGGGVGFEGGALSVLNVPPEDPSLPNTILGNNNHQMLEGVPMISSQRNSVTSTPMEKALGVSDELREGGHRSSLNSSIVSGGSSANNESGGQPRKVSGDAGANSSTPPPEVLAEGHREVEQSPSSHQHGTAPGLPLSQLADIKQRLKKSAEQEREENDAAASDFTSSGRDTNGAVVINEEVTNSVVNDIRSQMLNFQ